MKMKLGQLKSMINEAVSDLEQGTPVDPPGTLEFTLVVRIDAEDLVREAGEQEARAKVSEQLHGCLGEVNDLLANYLTDVHFRGEDIPIAVGDITLKP